MNYHNIVRTHTDFQAPSLLPNAAHLLNAYGHLIEPNETVRLDAFADRIERHYDNLRCAIEAGEVRRWYDLMCFCEDHLNEFDTLPVTFEWEFETYSHEDILALLGPAAVDYWLADEAA